VADNITVDNADLADFTAASDEVQVGGTQPLAQVQFVKLVDGTLSGGGPIEAIYRMVTRKNQVVPLDEVWWVPPMKGVDAVAKECLWLAQQVIPNFDYYNMSAYVANGFDVSFSAALLPSIMVTAGFVLPCLIIGYYSLRLRELESK